VFPGKFLIEKSGQGKKHSGNLAFIGPGPQISHFVQCASAHDIPASLAAKLAVSFFASQQP